MTVIKHVAFFTICEKLTMALTLTSLPLTFIPLFPDVLVLSGLNKNIGGSTDLVKEARGIGGSAYPYSSSLLRNENLTPRDVRHLLSPSIQSFRSWDYMPY